MVASVTWYTRSRGSDAELTQQEAHTGTLHNGRISEFKWGLDLGKALEAAGLSEGF